MSNAFSRSWEITKLSFEVMKKDKELFLFPLLGGIFSIIFLIAIIFPTVILSAAGFDSLAGGMLYLILFIIYFGLAVIATFFNVCTVYTVKTRFEGGDATFAQSIKFAFSKFHLIIAWSIISAIVGLIFRILEELAERLGPIGEIIARIFIGMLGAAWAIIASFVIPGMIYKNIGPIDALKDSVSTVKKTWGESLIRYYGLGLIEFVLIVLAIIMTIIFAVLTAGIPVLFWIVIGLGVVGIVALLMFFSVANAIFTTALYHYAQKGKIPSGFTAEVVTGAFAKKK